MVGVEGQHEPDCLAPHHNPDNVAARRHSHPQFYHLICKYSLQSTDAEYTMLFVFVFCVFVVYSLFFVEYNPPDAMSLIDQIN